MICVSGVFSVYTVQSILNYNVKISARRWWYAVYLHLVIV